jgi:hypothetical protein
MVTYPMPITVARVGANTTLKCDGKNYEEIDWWRWRDKVMIKPGKTGFLRFQKTDSGSKLHIRDVTMKDNGSYVCQFFASSQTTIRTVELVVQGSSSNLVTTETETTTVFPTTSSSFGASDTNTTSSTSPTFYTTPVERTLGQEPVLNKDSSSTAVFLFYCSHSQQRKRYRLIALFYRDLYSYIWKMHGCYR